MTQLYRTALILTVTLAVVAGCSDDGGGDEAAGDGASTTSTNPSTTTTTATPACPSAERPLEIVLANDDGVVNPAIDAMVAELDAMGGIELTIVAPAEERSGSSDQTTEGGAPYAEATTPGGHQAYSVDGLPADAVGVALDDLGLDPDLFVAGVNPGQNVGPLAAVSGTVGVGRTAIRRGYPALAVSAGLTFDAAQFAFGAELAGDWIEDNCDALASGTAPTDTVTSINIPQCPVEAMGELREVTRATELPEGVNVFESTCDQADPEPADDIAAIRAGFPAITQVPADLPVP